MYNKINVVCALSSFIIINSLNNTYAGGYQMHEQNGSLGDVHAGYSVDSHDASTNFFNPAGLTEITHSETTSSAVTVASMVKFKGETKLQSNPGVVNPVTGQPDSIQSYGKASVNGVHLIPSIHYAAPINDKFAFGLSIASPFAAEIDWSDKKFTKYNSTLNGITTINFSPSLAYKVNKQLSLGFGTDIQYVDMKVNKIVGASFDPAFQNRVPSSLDSVVTNNLTNTGFGWHAGLLWKPSNAIKFGYSFRSGINHHAQGVSKLKGDLAGRLDNLSSNKVNKSKKLKTVIKVPTTMALSGEIKPNHDLAWVSTVIHTKWSVIDSVDFENTPTSFVNPFTNEPMYTKLVSTTMNFKDTYTFLNGLHWQYNNKLILKTGLGYDQTPSSNHHRDLKMPDGNRYLFGLGASYDYSKSINVEFGWMYVQVAKTKINKQSIIPPTDVIVPGTNPPMVINTSNPGEINEVYGKAVGHANLIGMQFTVNPDEVLKYFI